MTGYLSNLLPAIEEDFERQARKAKYAEDPALWAENMFGITFNEKQTEIANDVANGSIKSVAVRAGHGTGKSYLASVLMCWWIDTHPIQHVFVASTAPSADQVSGILWRVAKNLWWLSHKRYKEYLRLTEQGIDTGDLPDHPLPGIISQVCTWKDDMGNLIGQGRKPPDNKDEDSFQGIHNLYVLSVGDEAGGLREGMIDALANITTGRYCKRLLIGNPSNPGARFGTIFNEQSGAFSLHHMSVFDNPRFHGGGVCECEQHKNRPLGLGMSEEALSSLSGPEYVEEKRLEYGEDSARYKVRVLGDFANDMGDTLFSDYEIARARDAIAFIDWDGKPKIVLGVDVARSKFGDTTFVYSAISALMYDLDDEIGTPLRVGKTPGVQLRHVDHYRGVPLVDRYEVDGSFTVGQATLIHQHAVNLGADEVRIDSGGLGVGLVDGVMALCRGHYRVVEMQGGSASPDTRYWINNRAFQLDHMRKMFEDGQVDIDPQDKLLIQQLEDILVEYVDPHLALKIEGKSSMKKRGMKSPDAADAAWYACADVTAAYGPQPGDVVAIDPWANRSRVGMPI